MVPCLRLYGWLACELADAYCAAGPPACPGEAEEVLGGAVGAEEGPEGAAAGNPYWEWVASYSAPEYLRLPAAAEAALDAAAAAGGADAGESRGGAGGRVAGGWVVGRVASGVLRRL